MRIEEAGAAEDEDAVLARARESATRRRRSWRRRPLSGRVSALMWLLRLYVVVMLAVVALQLGRLV